MWKSLLEFALYWFAFGWLFISTSIITGHNFSLWEWALITAPTIVFLLSGEEVNKWRRSR